MLPLRTRLAPTPSGRLHPGNAISFLLTWTVARAAGGTILLRIDDLDKARRRQDFVADVFETLEWLGIDYDEGPSGVDDFLRHWSQHTRLDYYQQALTRLRDQGRLFACRCSRREVQERTVDGVYRGHCRELGLDFADENVTWRVSVPEHTSLSLRDWRWGRRTIDLSGYLGDFVVRRKNGLPAYQIASLVDDDHFNINFIVRGEDLFSSTGAQLFLAQLLGDKRFSRNIFWHHKLLKDEQGEKLSKSKGAGSLAEWREAGHSPTPLYQLAADWLNIYQTITDPNQLVEGLRSRGVENLSG